MSNTNKDCFRATNMVMVTHANQNINLLSLYELLTLVQVDFTVGMKHSEGSRVKVPFFGVEGAIVAVRFMNKSRGIRNKGGQLRNVVAIDIQYCNKNIHLKVSTNKVALMGALTEAMGNGAFQLLLAHMEMVQGHYAWLKQLPADKLQASIKWLCETLYGPPTDEDLRNTLKKRDDPDVMKAFASLPRDVDKRTVTYLSMFAHEYKFYNDFVTKLETILTLQAPIYTQLPKLGPGKIHNAVYNYRIGCRVSLVQLCRLLLERGYGASYQNWCKSKSMQVMVPIKSNDALDALQDLDLEDEGDEGDEEKFHLPLPVKQEMKVGAEQPGTPEVPSPPAAKSDRAKRPAHRFTIYQGGAIRQSSPSIHTVAEQVKNTLLKDIHEILATAETDKLIS